MRKVLLALVCALGACGGSSGDGGAYTPEEVDGICRAWCLNEPNGPSCKPASWADTQG